MNFTNLLAKMNNPFKKLTPDENLALMEIELSVKKDIKKFAAIAREMLDDIRYKELRSIYDCIYEQNLKLIVFYENDDPMKFLFKIKEFQTQLKTMKNIFDTPEGFLKSQAEMENDANKSRKQDGAKQKA